MFCDEFVGLCIDAGMYVMYTHVYTWPAMYDTELHSVIKAWVVTFPHTVYCTSIDVLHYFKTSHTCVSETVTALGDCMGYVLIQQLNTDLCREFLKVQYRLFLDCGDHHKKHH